MANCVDFASSLGSISHNTMFMNPNTNALFIPRLFNGASNEYQKLLDQISGINTTYADSTLSILNLDHTGPYCYILSKQLRQYFGDEVSEEYNENDFVSFLLYCRYALMRGLNINRNAVAYYGRCMDFWAQLQKRQDLMQKYGIQFK